MPSDDVLAAIKAGISSAQVTVSLADLMIVHDYARQFDVAGDPAYERIGKAIEDAEQAIRDGLT